jgi:dihydrofolate reductase
MKPHIILYIATSRDGFIADKDGGVDWLNEFSAALPPGMDCGYADFFKSIDLIVIGRKTYEQMLTFGDWPNAGKHTYVFTESTSESPRSDITFVAMDIKDFVDQIETQQPGCRIWLEGGAHLVQQFYDAGLIDEYIITTIPVDIHEGIALPKQILNREQLREISAFIYSNDIEQRHYVKKT